MGGETCEVGVHCKINFVTVTKIVCCMSLIPYLFFYMRYSTPLFNNVPTHVTVDFACVLRAGSTVTYVRRRSQLDTIVQLQYLFQHYKCSYGMKLCAQTTFVKVTRLILQCYRYWNTCR